MKKLFSILVALTIGIMGFAQNYESTGAWGMPYFNVTGGVVTPLTSLTSFSDAINDARPVVAAEIGTYVTPVWGFSVTGEGIINNLGTHTAFDGSNVVFNGKANISNLLAGYKGYPRRVELVVVPGIGWSRQYGYENEIFDRDYLTYNANAELNLNMGKQRAWQINVRPGVIWSMFDGNFNFDKRHAALRLTAGVTYKFKNGHTKSHNFKTNDYAVSQHDYDVLLAKYEECSRREPVVKEVETVVEKKVVETVDVPVYFGETFITFDVNKSVLKKSQKQILDEFIKNITPDTIVHIVGSADSATGTEARNNELAHKRAEVVRDYLLSKNVKAESIQNDTKIDAGTSVETSRSAVLTLELVDAD